jgi:hypothetical protein
MNRSSDTKVKEDIAALHHLVAGMPRKVLSAKDIVEQFQVSEETRKEIKDRFPREGLFEERFRFVPSEFLKHVVIKTIELDNGALLTASTERFDEVFIREVVDPTKAVVKFSTEGKIIDQRFRKVVP